MPSMSMSNTQRRSSRPVIDTAFASNDKSRSASSSGSATGCFPRPPLAPLDPQSAVASAAPEFAPSSSSSSPASGSADRKPMDYSSDSARPNIGHPILLDQIGTEAQDVATRLPAPKRSAATSNANTRPSRRAAHVHTASSSSISSRRGSLPAIHLRHPSSAFGETSTGFSSNSTWASDSTSATSIAYLTNDDLYSGLSTFTFGAAQTVVPAADQELISPLTAVRRGSADKTPRPSISGISISRLSDGREQENIPADHDEAVRSVRSKMRAVDDGTRRPSLPTNFHSERRHADMSASYETDNDPAFDTDVEVEGAEAQEMLMSDRVSVHTFGGDSSHRSAFDSTLDLSEGPGGSGGPDSPLHSSPIEDGQADGQYDASIHTARRGSLPMDIRISNLHISSGTSQPRDREGSVATMRRPSRSLGDALPSSGSVAEAAAATSSSQPQTRGDWDNLSVQIQSPGMEDARGYHGLDMDYITDYLTDGARRMSTQSYVAPIISEDARGTSHGFGFSSWGLPISGAGRRPSTATVGSDTFLKHVTRWNDTTDWMFKKEQADGKGTSVRSGTTGGPGGARPRNEGMRVGSQELWRCPYVGRFKVDRAAMMTDPMKPQQRLTIKHIVDPFSKGNARGGPGVVIHKHSRAIAFSIFRRHDLFSNRNGVNTSLSMNFSILLAPKKVQEQYTSTRTTSHLQTYGLLEDRPNRGGGGRPKSSSGVREGSRNAKDGTKRDKDKEKKDHKGKDKGKESSLPPSDRSRETTPAVESWTAPQHKYPSSASFAAGSSTIDSASDPYQTSSSKNSSLDYSEHFVTATTSYSQYPPSDRDNSMDTDDEYEHHPPRTSHAEAFATLNPDAMGHIKPERRLNDHPPATSSRSFGKGLLSRNKGARKGNASSIPHPAIDQPFTPPWMTMAPRSKQEEQERIIATIDESFRGVGLLPAYRSDRTRMKAKDRHNNSNAVDFLEDVPHDSLYMLLPLWPGQTDPGSSTEVHPSLDLKLEDRQYLLVYYIPFERKKSSKDKDKDSKKRSRSQTTTETSASHQSKTILLESFRVCARLLGYDDLRGSGVRLPTDGLAITGPMSDAINSIPHAHVRAQYPQSMVIAMCDRREDGIQFMPDGLEKLGLCTPAARRDSIPDLDPDPQLTAVGRAAVEMAWLGCMALTSIGNA